MNEFRMIPAIIFAVAMMAIPTYAQRTAVPVTQPGESYEGPCFIDDYRACQYALGEYQSQGGESDIVANCNECDPEAQAVIQGQPVYYCLTAGKKEVVVAGLINWVKSVESGKLLWGSEMQKTDCGIQMRCKSICEYDATGVNLFCWKEEPEAFLLSGRFARGISCP